MGNRSPGDFLQPVYHLLIVQTEAVICPFVDEKKETNGSYPFAYGLNKQIAYLLCLHIILDSTVKDSRV
jgi:hypothetical protein